jgi:PD-(D/E)XK nuclease superfamily
MSVFILTMGRMALTDPQRRTLEQLIGTGGRPSFPADLPQRLRDRIEEAARELELRDPLWLGKEKLNDHARCEGKFDAAVAGESPPFEHSARSAAGVLLHKAIEVEVGSREPLDPHAVAEVAVARLLDREDRFQEYWGPLAAAEQDEVLMEVVRQVTLFQGSFPPLKELRRELAPVSELRVRVELLGGDLTLSGQIDLVLGAPDRLDPSRATRLVMDLKTGNAYPEFAEDMRFYALLMTLRFGGPPYRAASFFLESGSWQAEDVTEEALMHAADRVVAAARTVAALSNGREPALSAGPYCGWCPRAAVCPAAELAAVGAPAPA